MHLTVYPIHSIVSLRLAIKGDNKMHLPNQSVDTRPVCQFGSHKADEVQKIELPFQRFKTACNPCITKHEAAKAAFLETRAKYKGQQQTTPTTVLERLDEIFRIEVASKTARTIDIETDQGIIACNVVRSQSGYTGCAEFGGHAYTAWAGVPSHVVTKIVDRLKAKLQIV